VGERGRRAAWRSGGGEHLRRGACGGYTDKRRETVEEGERGRKLVLVTDTSHAVEEA